MESISELLLSIVNRLFRDSGLSDWTTSKILHSESGDSNNDQLCPQLSHLRPDAAARKLLLLRTHLSVSHYQERNYFSCRFEDSIHFCLNPLKVDLPILPRQVSSSPFVLSQRRLSNLRVSKYLSVYWPWLLRISHQRSRWKSGPAASSKNMGKGMERLRKRQHHSSLLPYTTVARLDHGPGPFSFLSPYQGRSGHFFSQFPPAVIQG